jgi:hypothetical protein
MSAARRRKNKRKAANADGDVPNGDAEGAQPQQTTSAVASSQNATKTKKVSKTRVLVYLLMASAVFFALKKVDVRPARMTCHMMSEEVPARLRCCCTAGCSHPGHHHVEPPVGVAQLHAAGVCCPAARIQLDLGHGATARPEAHRRSHGCTGPPRPPPCGADAG